MEGIDMDTSIIDKKLRKAFQAIKKDLVQTRRLIDVRNKQALDLVFVKLEKLNKKINTVKHNQEEIIEKSNNFVDIVEMDSVKENVSNNDKKVKSVESAIKKLKKAEKLIEEVNKLKLVDTVKNVKDINKKLDHFEIEFGTIDKLRKDLEKSNANLLERKKLSSDIKSNSKSVDKINKKLVDLDTVKEFVADLDKKSNDKILALEKKVESLMDKKEFNKIFKNHAEKLEKSEEKLHKMNSDFVDREQFNKIKYSYRKQIADLTTKVDELESALKGLKKETKVTGKKIEKIEKVGEKKIVEQDYYTELGSEKEKVSILDRFVDGLVGYFFEEVDDKKVKTEKKVEAKVEKKKEAKTEKKAEVKPEPKKQTKEDKPKKSKNEKSKGGYMKRKTPKTVSKEEVDDYANMSPEEFFYG